MAINVKTIGIFFSVIYFSQSFAFALEFVASNQNELEWTLSNINPGDVIHLGDLVIPIDRTLKTSSSGLANNPITIKGGGPLSELRGIIGQSSMSAVFSVENSNWLVENLIVDGRYTVGLRILPSAVNVTISQVNFKNTDGEGEDNIATNGINVNIDNCTFYCSYTGVWHKEDGDGGLGSTRVTNSRFITGSPGWSWGIFIVRSAHFISENNTFVIDSAFPTGYWNDFIVAHGTKLTVRNNIGTRASSSGIRIVDSISSIPIAEQEYIFEGNHCDLQFDVYCIHVYEEELFNRTFISPDNTFENGYALTNVPGHY